MFFAMMIVLFVVMRFALGGRRGGCVPLHHHRHRQFRPVPIQPSSRPQSNAFERLKQRYIHGDISDEQYESELDALLRMPETRKLVP
jgi:uncharacterized membrane protein